MNTQTHVHRLEAGQVLTLPRHGAGPAVLTEGELLAQAPARWLGGVMVLSAPTRLVAPALLPSEPACSFVAVGASSVTVQEAPPLLHAAVAWIRGLLSRPVAPGARKPFPG